MSICEVYEWLAEKYPECQYTKYKIRKVLLHDSEREQPRFMIANKHRLPGVPCRWAIRPEMEPELRRLCYPPLGRESQVLQSLGDRCHCTEDDQPTEAEGRNKTGSDAASSAIAVLRQIPQDNFRRGSLYTKAAIALRKGTVELGRVKIDGDSIHNLLPRSIADKLGLSLHSSGTIRIRVENRSIPISQYCRFSIQVAGVETTIDTYVVSELPSLLLGRAWIQEVRLLRGVGNHMYYIRGPLGNLIKLPNPTSTTEADTDSVTGECEAAPVAEELPTAAEAEECELGESGDETISEDEVWKDTVSRQSTEDDIYSVDRILAEKQEDRGTHYLLLWDGYTEDQSTWEPLQNIRDKELLDIWRERKAQELRGMVPAFDLVNFEKRRRKRLGLALRERRSKLQMKRVGMPVLSSELMLMILLDG
jgi:Chromo (CHRromatin Organisation MOdifier) domain